MGGNSNSMYGSQSSGNQMPQSFGGSSAFGGGGYRQQPMGGMGSPGYGYQQPMTGGLHPYNPTPPMPTNPNAQPQTGGLTPAEGFINQPAMPVNLAPGMSPAMQQNYANVAGFGMNKPMQTQPSGPFAQPTRQSGSFASPADSMSSAMYNSQPAQQYPTQGMFAQYNNPRQQPDPRRAPDGGAYGTMWRSRFGNNPNPPSGIPFLR